MENGRITTSVKGGDVVRHPLLPTTLDRLRALVVGCKPEDPLFTDPRTGKGWNLDGGGSIPMWGRDFLGCKAYDLKRFAITGMLRRGMKLAEVALFTGHRTKAQILEYVRSNENEAREALSLLC